MQNISLTSSENFRIGMIWFGYGKTLSYCLPAQSPILWIRNTLRNGKGFTEYGRESPLRELWEYVKPYSVSKMMAAMTTIDVIDTVRKNGYATLNDPTCGAGAMLIASLHEAGEKLKKEGMNWQNHLLVSGQDIDYTAALMCYIQLSLLGAAGFVKIGDSLTSPIAGANSLEDCWFTPMYFSDVWALRRVISLAKAN